MIKSKRNCIILYSPRHRTLIRSIINKVTHFVPKHCLFCLEKTHTYSDLCKHCIASLTLNNHCCRRCAAPLEQSIEQDTVLCGDCLSHDCHYDRVFSPFLYSEEMAYLIKKFKYQQKIHYANILSMLFIQKISILKNFQLPQVIIPVPMHTKRLKKRGFNQALELSRIFASHYQLPLNYSSFIRHRYTDLQAEMSASRRQKNVQQAFLVKKPIHYSHVALVDDVMTTGSTVNEAAKVLKKNGIEKVDVWTIARAGMN
ncbi:MAG: ComF family protein [gamma proteobacterium symbiont of Bathyaustriella thionipta]|nr:ComF family protein [gamma proteobacterium symbiont of Bathyaustriella thionipta]MCU7950826.1 ComF family protein [gamma proteobacterium symbiont of Bathyaustriella thionipta]MCU7952049.1 ComF family protein [gamma proteobacterium symbiont of Bathyaustriella thionipta]MCU7957338.1 ComF family protein [gamma proteobacterium symbiont of Bathyaustriella thionipta]MCU7967400.1 ComF family protein [gamma proteobacterium symbiont of Bathyaustriella thionipta]